MQTGTDHIAITIRELEKENVSLGRAKNNDHVFLMNLDIRLGRTKATIRISENFLLSKLKKIFGINRNNFFLTFTNHQGIEFNFYNIFLRKFFSER